MEETIRESNEDNAMEQNTLDPAGPLPWLYGALVFYIPPTVPKAELANLLPGLEWKEYDNSLEIEVLYREVRDVYSWEIDDLLSKLFSICDFKEIAFIQSQLGGRAFIDISFHHYDTYPALVFEGKNMEIIHRLNADIGIDPY